MKRLVEQSSCAIDSGNWAFTVLEPYEEKFSCTVLRGRWRRNALLLPDKLVAATLVNMMCARPVGGCKSKLCRDLGYDDDEVRRIVHLAGFEPVILCRYGEQENKKQRGARAGRWVVERTHSWRNQFRRLFVRWEKREGT